MIESNEQVKIHLGLVPGPRVAPPDHVEVNAFLPVATQVPTATAVRLDALINCCYYAAI